MTPPPWGLAMSDIRTKAREILDKALPPGKIITSNGDPKAYTEMTGLTHAGLTANWAKKGKLTGCNGFTGWFGQKLGATSYIGLFDLEKYARTAGKPEAWIVSKPDNRPQYGDILRHASFHVDVALDFDGDILNRAAGGQGGPAAGCDIIKRVRGKSAYNSAALVGWIDIDIMFGGGAASHPVPAWLLGWWTISEGPWRYYYYFYRNGEVQYTPNASYLNVCPNLGPAATGAFSVDAGGNVTVRWGGDASDESFVRSPAGSQTSMTGSYADGGALRMQASKAGG